MQRLQGKTLLLVGFTLFSMFFGAGNLIFPPYLGAQAGVHFWFAFAGFAASAVLLPVLGVVAATQAGGLPQLASRVHPVFAQVFTMLVYLSIGPCLAIPRTASTSFEMLSPLLGSSRGLQLAYSAVFFLTAFLIALQPERLTARLGRVLCPALLILILVLFSGCLLDPIAPHYAPAVGNYQTLPAAQGMLDGYQTMDALAGLNFGAVLALNIRALGVTEEKEVQRGARRAGFITAGLLLAVYGMLGHIGALTGYAYPQCSTGAQTLTVLAQALFGHSGQILLASIFLIACFNTCVGLLASVSDYFHKLCPRLPYPALAAFFAVVSMLISNLGLASIIRLSTPVLNALYPAAILLILLPLIPGLHHRRAVYQWSIAFAAVQSIAAALPLGPLSALAQRLPLSSIGFGWLLPAMLGLSAGLLLDLCRKR